VAFLAALRLPVTSAASAFGAPLFAESIVFVLIDLSLPRVAVVTLIALVWRNSKENLRRLRRLRRMSDALKGKCRGIVPFLYTRQNARTRGDKIKGHAEPG
jgi:hypothetical protein